MVFVARVFVHRTRGLRALTAEIRIELVDILNMTAIPAGKDNFF